MAIKFGQYQVCLLDLITDEKSGKLSMTKLWYHVANVILSMEILKQTSIDWQMVLAYGSVVGGSHLGTLWLKKKYDVSTPVVTE